MTDLILIQPAQWEVREPGVLGLVGTDNITIHIDVTTMQHYEVRYKGKRVSDGTHATLAKAKARAMVLPALLFDFGMEA